MTLSLYTNAGDVKSFTRTLTAILEDAPGTLRDASSALRPEILVECPYPAIMRANYMSVPDLGRKYFVTDVVAVRQGLYLIKARVDVLATYEEQIKLNTGIIKRQKNVWNLYLNDGAFRVYQNPHVTTLAFPSGFGQWSYVLAVAGA